MTDHSHHGHGEHTHDSHHIHFESQEMAAYTELEGEVLIDLMTSAASVLANQCEQHGVDVRRVLDIGSGPGVGTCCLAQQFDSAHVVAADGSAAMLEQATARAARLGLGARVESRLVEFPDGLATLGRADVAWASMVIHHVGDEVDALRRIRSLLEPSGMLAVIEWADPMRLQCVNGDLGTPGMWERLDAAWRTWFAEMRASLPDSKPSADYPTMLARAGFEVLVDQVLALDLDAPLGELARRHAQLRLSRSRTQLSAQADSADLDALAALTDENSDVGIMRRDDVQLRATRHLYVARVQP